MPKAVLAILVSAAALGSIAATSAQAMPIARSARPPAEVDQVRYVCNEWGRCWWRPDYYRPYGYYRYRDHDEGPRYYGYRRGEDYDRPRYWGGYGRWYGREHDDD
jgi:hypothetical protein